MADSLYPPHSRLFVACDRDMTEEELTSAFEEFGTVASVKLCKDRATGNQKGFAFVQFDKTSEAANAMEALNGTSIGRSNRLIKVTVALAKDQGSGSSAVDQSQFLRLFLVVPRTYIENDLQEHFSQFGSIDTVTIMRDRETKESKGYAYVKFKKFSDAARAYENCERTYKVVFAKPKEQSGGRPKEQYSMSAPAPYPEPAIAGTRFDDNPDGFTCLRAIVSADLPDDQIEWLFDIPPGLQFVRFFKDPPPYMGYNSGYSRKVMAQYDSPRTAAYALRKLDGFEYPAGDRIAVEPDYQHTERAPGPAHRRHAQNSVNDLMQQVETLTKSLTDANRVLKSAGLNVPGGRTAGQLESFRCSAKLPPPQPLAPSNSISQERLFLVCEPGLPPQEALWDVFSRFGNLIELYILNGKNCGYAKYSDKASAHRAMQALNGHELYRMRMKVLIADPQREDRKRPRTSYD